ncbi:hypothetical protein ACFV9C_33710 [Kribbella sp. NPDC059898]|uniref:hypothetical protein n=1 Tax=Kribbella sp. NPDC059898 TaxID=3346995 RepID=UPI0036629E08
MAEPTVTRRSPFGWTATADDTGHAVLRAPSGHVRATWQLVRWTGGGKALPWKPPATTTLIPYMLQTHPVTVYYPDAPSEEALITFGSPTRTRRRDHNGTLQLAGRTYQVLHFRGRRTELQRAGTLIASTRSGILGRLHLRSATPADDLDQLAVALVWFAIGPGRPGAIAMLTDFLSI